MFPRDNVFSKNALHFCIIYSSLFTICCTLEFFVLAHPSNSVILLTRDISFNITSKIKTKLSRIIYLFSNSMDKNNLFYFIIK